MKAKFMLHSAVTIMGEQRFTGIILPNGKPQYAQGTPDKEICQFAAEWPTFPVPERHFIEAFREMERACLQKAHQAGLISSKA